MIVACAPCPFVSVSSNLIVAVAAFIVFMSLSAAIAFLFFGYLAYLDDYQDMPHEEEAHNEH